MKLPLISPVIDFLKEMGGKYMELQRTKAEGRIVVETARAKAEATVLVTRAEAAADWERVQAENSGSSWKDEFWTLLLALPIPLVFYPDTREWVRNGFEALATMPEWYMWALIGSISASFGIRSGLLDNLKLPSLGKKGGANG